jgi:hypothetical protein
VTAYRCDGCRATQTAFNDLAGMAHTRTGGKPSRCPGRWWPVPGRAAAAPRPIPEPLPDPAPAASTSGQVVDLDAWRWRRRTRRPYSTDDNDDTRRS